MVRIERINRPEQDTETDPLGERFRLIEVYIQEPTSSPDDEFKVFARPYEFESEIPTKYSTSCPHCGQGIWFESNTIRSAVDRFFIHCPECDKGSTVPIQPMVDPFLNPVAEKIAEILLDTDLSKAQDLKSDKGTVQEKMQSVDIEPSDDKAIDNEPSEIEQLLEELEGDSE